MGLSLYDRVRSIIADIKTESVGACDCEIAEETILADPPLSMDSLEFARLVIQLENAFGFVADDDDFVMSELRTVRNIMDIVERRSSASAAQ